MIQAIATTIVLVVATAIQLLVPQFTVLADAKAPVVLALVLYYGLTRPVGRTLVIAFFAGLLVDALGFVPLGYSSVCFCAIGLAASMFRTFVFEDTLVTQLFFGAVGTLLATLGIMLALGDRIALADCSWWWICARITATVVMGAAITPAMFAMGRSMDHVIESLVGESPA